MIDQSEMGDASMWVRVRKEYPALSTMTYMDTSSCGLVARSTLEAAQDEQMRLMREGSIRYQHWMTGGRDGIRGAVASSVNAAPHEVALVQGFSVGVAQLAPLLRHRRKVLLIEGDYPTLHSPFGRGGFELIRSSVRGDGSIELDDLEAIMQKERPGILAISHVQWRTGFKVSLEAIAELCRRYSVLSIIDATQSWGSIAISVKALGIDILGASGYKWPLAGFGNGFMFMSGAVIEEVKAQVGAGPVEALTGGHMDPVALVRLGDAVDRMRRVGLERIEARVSALCEHAVERLEEGGVKILNGTDGSQRGGILMIDGDETLVSGLGNKGVKVAKRGKGVRIGIHYYNTIEDIEQLVSALTA